MKDIQKIKEFFSKPLEETTFKKGDKITYLGYPGVIKAVNKEMTGDITYTVSYDKGTGKTTASNISNKGGQIKLAEVKKETAVDMAKKQLDALGVKYELSGNEFKPFKAIYKPTNKPDRWYDEFEDIIHLFNLGSAVKQSIKENNSIDYTKLISLIKSANNPRNLPIYYNSDNGVVNIGGVGYDKGELVKMFNSQPGQSLDIKNLFYKANQNPEETKNAIESMDPSIKVEIGYGYGNEPFVKYIKSINEANGFTSGKQFINIKLKNYPKAVAKVNQLIDMIGESNFTMEMAEWIWDFFNNASFESPVYEATKDEETTFHKKLDTLVHNTFGKRKGELEEVNLKQSKLSSAEYQKAKKLKDFKASDWKWNKDEDLYIKVNEGELTEAKSFTIDSYSASDSDKITDFLTQNNISFKKVGPKIKISLDRNTPKASVILSKLNKLAKFDELNEAELTEAYVPSNIKEFAKRKGVSSLVNKIAGWAEKVGKSITGGTAIGYNYSTLILDMTYQGSEIRINTDNDTVTLYDEPVYSFNDFKQVYLDNQDIEENVAPNHNGKAAPYGSGYKPLEEKIAEALDKINEELCPAGKAYIKRRKAAGEKSSAYLSGRAVKVCKGQMSGRAKKKK